jgi:hypothetical protein
MATYITKAENQVYVLQKIQAAAVLNRDRLKHSTANTPVSTVAWLTRNLLELVIWAAYCRSNEERAHEFMLDGARDAYDALDIPEAIILPGSRNKIVRAELLDKAKADGFDIEESYTKVSNAAKEIGYGLLFKHLNKTFSKFAHPTAFAILSLGSKEEQLIKEKAQKMGMHLADAALMFTDLSKPAVNPFPEKE